MVWITSSAKDGVDYIIRKPLKASTIREAIRRFLVHVVN